MVETRVLIFKAFNKNARFDQLLPGPMGFVNLVNLFFCWGWGVGRRGFPITQGSHCKFMYIYK